MQGRAFARPQPDGSGLRPRRSGRRRFTYFRCSPSSHLDRRAPRPSRCDAALPPRAACRHPVAGDGGGSEAVPASREMDVTAFIATLDIVERHPRRRLAGRGRPRAPGPAGHVDGARRERALHGVLPRRRRRPRDGTAAATSWAGVRSGAVARIEGMRDEASHLTLQGTAPPAHLRGALAEVLAAPEFRGRQRYAALLGLVDGSAAGCAAGGHRLGQARASSCPWCGGWRPWCGGSRGLPRSPPSCCSLS